MREWIVRLIDWLRRDRLDRELQEELRFHQRHLETAAAAEGAGTEAARRDARSRLGDPMRITEATRERWSIRWMDHLQQDVRQAVRGLRRTPGFTVAVVATLALGIGANAATFAVVDRLMFRPLDDLRDPARVHRVYTQNLDRGRLNITSWTTFGRFADLASTTTSFEAVAGFVERQFAVGVGESVRELPVVGVSASFFDFFDVSPVQGRFFGAEEDRAPMGAAVSVLAHSFWQSEYQGRDVIGSTLQVGNLATTIVGVAPASLVGINDAQPAQLFLPITSIGPAFGGPDAARYAQGYDSFWGHMMVRRRDGVSADAASADLTAAFHRSWAKQRELQPRLAALDEAKPRALVSGLRLGGGPDPSLNARTALWIGGVSALVLLIATANVANLWVGRALARRRETALRLACGIGRGRLLAQLMTESLVVAVASAAAGLGLAYWGSAVMFRLLTTATGSITGMLDDRVLLATIGVTVLVAMLTAIGPALFAHRVPVAASLKTGPRGTAEGMRLKTSLAIAQASLSLMLIVGAILFVRSFMAAKSAPLGYQPEHVLTVNRTYRGAPLPAPERAELRRRLLEAARAHPAVEAASWRFTTPFGTSAQARFTVEGIESVERLGPFTTQEASADYFTVMGTRIVKGRAFNADDRPDTPRVVVVSETMAETLWPGKDPLGQCMRFAGPTAGTCTTVVGVAEDVVLTRLTSRDKHFYLSLDQSTGDGTGLFLRVRGEPADHAESVRRALQPFMPGTSYITVQPLDTLVSRGHQSWRTGAALFVTFGVLALAVAAIGLYGVLNYGIAQRLPEVGVRLALGARRADILWLVLRPSVGLAFGGVAVGTALTLFAGRWIEPLLFQQSATDASAYVSAGAVLTAVALAAAIPPAARALATDPSIVLKGD